MSGSTWESSLIAGLTNGDLLLGWPCRHKGDAGSFKWTPVAAVWVVHNGAAVLHLALLSREMDTRTSRFDELTFDPNGRP